jgi:hypothetical protein
MSAPASAAGLTERHGNFTTPPKVEYVPGMSGPELEAYLRYAWTQRIHILDGAMGTMIQKHQLNEAQFRGERFKDHPNELKGDNYLLCFTQPEIIQEIHSVSAHHQQSAAHVRILSTLEGIGPRMQAAPLSPLLLLVALMIGMNAYENFNS